MNIFRFRSLRWTFALACLIIVGVVVFPKAQPVAAQSLSCGTGAFLIDQTLANGSRWEMCWEPRALEGIVLRFVTYTTPPAAGSLRRQILYRTHLSQIHVPYDNNSARFHDVSDYGLGNNINNLTAADCPGGTLLASGGVNRLCRTLAGGGYAYKYYGTQKQSQTMTLFSVSHIGQYNYIVQWRFHDDGTIEPAIGATGRLQLCTSSASYGWPIGPASNCAAGTPRGTSHMHNFFWYLDFDLNGAANDVIEEIEFSGSGASTRPMAITAFTTETARPFSQTTFRTWRVKDTATLNTDGRQISYELSTNASHVFRGPASEPFTNSDAYFTQYGNNCELFASHNTAAAGCGTDDVSAFVNGQTLSDIVVWYRVNFHHLTRDEDDYYMSPHWSSFLITPRDMTATNPR